MNKKYIGLITVGSSATVGRSRTEIMASGNSNKRNIPRLLAIRERWPEDMANLYELRHRRRSASVSLRYNPVMVSVAGPWEVVFREPIPPPPDVDRSILLFWVENCTPLCGYFMFATCLDDICWYQRQRLAYSNTAEQLPNDDSVNTLQQPRVANIADLIASNSKVTFFVKNRNRFYRAVPFIPQDLQVPSNGATRQPGHTEIPSTIPRSRAQSADGIRDLPGPSFVFNTARQSTSSKPRPSRIDLTGSRRE